ncbi:MAG: serine/threonine protein kinase [Candidatus Zixiibacteriota bacterium]|nr:MAG: serine/threonine protein kinase [candidate division Zixibacteria bacterium]
MKNLLHYQILKTLGRGKHGETFMAIDTGLQRPVAIKHLHTPLPGGKFRERFQDDMQRITALNQPTIAAFYSIEDIEGEQYLIREYIEGHTVAELARSRRLTFDRVLRLLIDAARALQSLHGHDSAHLNITPTNFFVTRDGSGRLADAGLAYGVTRRIDDDSKARDLVYLAPEQIMGIDVDGQTDFYSLGVVMYEMLTGRPMYEANSREQLTRSIRHESISLEADELSAVPGEARLVLERMLARDPADRFASASELLITLNEMASFHVSEMRAELTSTSRRDPRWYILLTVLAALLMILWLVVTTVYR